MNIIAIDHSTEITGIALVHVPEVGCPQVISSAAFNAKEHLRLLCKERPEIRKESAEKVRQRRIHWTRSMISRWLGALPIDGFDLLAYERGGGPGSQSDQAGDWALGAYLTVSHFIELPLVAVMRGSACTSVGAGAVYREKAGSTSPEKAAKRARLKAAVIAGVNQKCGLDLGESDDGRADAIAVGIAAGEAAWREQKVQKAAAAQGTLKLRRSPVKKEKVAS